MVLGLFFSLDLRTY